MGKTTKRTKSDIRQIPALIKRLYAIRNRLEAHFPGRKFSLDGHLVGSIGEVLAAWRYGIDLYPASAETHDGYVLDNNGNKIEVQIKATQVGSIGIRSEPVHLIVLKIHKDGTASEVYNGPGKYAWEAAGKMQKNGQKSISLSRLAELMKHKVKDEEKLPRVGS
jgi:hypothetical protein